MYVRAADKNTEKEIQCRGWDYYIIFHSKLSENERKTHILFQIT